MGKMRILFLALFVTILFVLISAISAMPPSPELEANVGVGKIVAPSSIVDFAALRSQGLDQPGQFN